MNPGCPECGADLSRVVVELVRRGDVGRSIACDDCGALVLVLRGTEPAVRLLWTQECARMALDNPAGWLQLAHASYEAQRRRRRPPP